MVKCGKEQQIQSKSSGNIYQKQRQMQFNIEKRKRDDLQIKSFEMFKLVLVYLAYSVLAVRIQFISA